MNIIEQHKEVLENVAKMRFNDKKRTLRYIKMHRGGHRYESKNARKARKNAVKEHARMKQMMFNMARPLLKMAYPASILNDLVKIQPLPRSAFHK